MYGYRLKQARDLRRITQSQLAFDLGVHQSAIAKIEQDNFRPSDELLGRIALHTGFPKSFFNSEDTVEFPEGSLVFYRKRAKLTAGDANYLYQLAHLAFEHLFARNAGKVRGIPVTLPRLTDEDVITAARLTRNALKLEPLVPIRGLIRRIEHAGVVCIAVSTKEIEEFDAFSTGVEKWPVIVFDATKPIDRIRLSAGHETGHLVLHQAVKGTSADTEDEAKAFAAELLMPEEAMRAELVLPLTLTSLFDLKLRWGVSMQALIVRAHTLKIITSNQYRHLMISLSRRRWRKDEPGSDQLPPEKPRQLRQMAEMLYGGDVRRLALEAGLPSELAMSLLETGAGERPLVFAEPSVLQFRGAQLSK
ncbi:MAG: XRE family transcriptional regulator [Thermoanaerobaculaceae bacterium]|jgi:Zn-dependent peptidase ImmA (M78 family)/DNA-binding XRE family transcriptional regulator